MTAVLFGSAGDEGSTATAFTACSLRGGFVLFGRQTVPIGTDEHVIQLIGRPVQIDDEVRDRQDSRAQDVAIVEKNKFAQYRSCAKLPLAARLMSFVAGQSSIVE